MSKLYKLLCTFIVLFSANASHAFEPKGLTLVPITTDQHWVADPNGAVLVRFNVDWFSDDQMTEVILPNIGTWNADFTVFSEANHLRLKVDMAHIFGKKVEKVPLTPFVPNIDQGESIAGDAYIMEDSIYWIVGKRGIDSDNDRYPIAKTSFTPIYIHFGTNGVNDITFNATSLIAMGHEIYQVVVPTNGPYASSNMIDLINKQYSTVPEFPLQEFTNATGPLLAAL